MGNEGCSAVGSSAAVVNRVVYVGSNDGNPSDTGPGIKQGKVFGRPNQAGLQSQFSSDLNHASCLLINRVAVEKLTHQKMPEKNLR
jgi:hypothetical protein